MRRWPWAPVEAACLLMGGAGCLPFGCFGLRRPGAGACRLLVGPGLRDQGPKMSASSIYDPRESRRRPLPPEETLQDPQVGRAQAAVQSCRCHARELACALPERSLLFLPPRPVGLLRSSRTGLHSQMRSRCQTPPAAEPPMGLRAHAGVRLCDVSVL